MRNGICALLALACLSAASVARAEDVAGAAAYQRAPDDFRGLYLFRFEFDNDNLLGKDNAFTAGWSFQLHSPLDDAWGPRLRWIGHVPGLGDDGEGGRIVRWAVGISQSIITPDDISISTPQPNDAPWAGTLGAAVSWLAYDNRRMAVLQVYAGCMGPCSGAASVQKFIHEDLGLGDPPQGWDNQLATKPLFNVNYEYRWKVLAPAAERYFTPRHFAQDFSIGSMAGVGNFETLIQGEFEYRLGWGLPMGFTKTPDPLGWGIMLDPVYVPATGPLPSEAKRWRAYFTVMGRLSAITYLAPAEGGETQNGGNHPPLRPYPGRYQLLTGVHLARIPFAYHLTYYKYFEQDPSDIQGSSDWINLSFEYRF